MGPYYGPVVLLLGVIGVQVLAETVSVQHSSNYEPEVAFMCNKPAMHRTAAGWVRDENTDCLKKPLDILKYCKKVYPEQDITNVVEATHSVKITNWCKYGHKHCHHHGTHTVRPFRCLVGAFQSDALLVPEHCLFDHIHNSNQCMSFKEWNLTSITACKNRQMSQQSFAMLLPCGIDMFSGVEFVCCPSVTTKVAAAKTHPAVTKYKSLAKSSSSAKKEKSAKVLLKTAPHHPESSPVDAYSDYMHGQKQAHYLNEHERFTAALKKWQQHHHEKITKMMKEWAAARKRVQEMKSTDPKAAEKLNKEITERFQKTYTALEQEGLAERNQLIGLHQQRIQAHLNEKKHKAMEHYMASLQAKIPDANRILSTLKHYIKSEEKDRIHTINHYKHVRENDPSEADRIYGQISEHLKVIDTRINQSIAMLSRVPKFEKKIKEQIESFLKTFHDVSEEVASVLIKPAAKLASDDIVKKYKEATAAERKQHKEAEHKAAKKQHLVAKKAEAKKPEMEEKAEAEKVAPPAKVLDDETDEDEHAYLDTKRQQQHVAHSKTNLLSVDQKDVKSVSMKSNKPGGILGITVGATAVFVVIVVAIVLLRKRSTTNSSRNFVEEVDQAASPEERHVANMQINGYENPTYKYFEISTN